MRGERARADALLWVVAAVGDTRNESGYVDAKDYSVGSIRDAGGGERQRQIFGPCVLCVFAAAGYRHDWSEHRRPRVEGTAPPSLDSGEPVRCVGHFADWMRQRHRKHHPATAAAAKLQRYGDGDIGLAHAHDPDRRYRAIARPKNTVPCQTPELDDLSSGAQVVEEAVPGYRNIGNRGVSTKCSK